MASKSTSSDSSSTDVKLVWNSPLDSEETFEVIRKASTHEKFSKNGSVEKH